MPRASGFFQTDPHPTPFFERAPAALSHNGKNRGSVPLRDGQAAAGRPYDRPAAAMRRENTSAGRRAGSFAVPPESSVRGRIGTPPSRAIPHVRPYKIRRKNISPREYLSLFPCESPAALSHNGKNRGSVPLRDGQAAAGRPHDRPAAAMRRETVASPCEGFPYAAEKKRRSQEAASPHGYSEFRHGPNAHFHAGSHRSAFDIGCLRARIRENGTADGIKARSCRYERGYIRSRRRSGRDSRDTGARL